MLIRIAQEQDSTLLDVKKCLKHDPQKSKPPAKSLVHFTLSDDLLFFKGKISIPENKDLQKRLLSLHHDHPTAGHQGRLRTLESLKKHYYWAGMKRLTMHM